MSLNKNQVEAIIYQLVRKLHNNDLTSWYIKKHPHDFEYLENGELGYYISQELVSLTKLEENFSLSFDEKTLLAFLDQLIASARLVTSLATQSDNAFMFYLAQIENL